MNVVNQLREQQLKISTQSFKARGSQQLRCNRCLQAKAYCLCPWQVKLRSTLDFVLLMHPKEPYKTSNTGRLIAEIFPGNTEAFIWSRTELPKRFFDLLNDPARNCVLLFPPNEGETPTKTIKHPQKKTTIIILDGTWKQASRMARLSPYLQNLPRISLNIDSAESYINLRQAPQEKQLSTAQATACLLDEIGEKDNSLALKHYATLLTHHTLAARDNKPLDVIQSHHYLRQQQALNVTNKLS